MKDLSRREFIRQSSPLAAIVAAPFGVSRSEAAIPGKSDLALTMTLFAVKADELKQVKGVNLVRAHCVACHSLKLVTQHRMSHWVTGVQPLHAKKSQPLAVRRAREAATELSGPQQLQSEFKSWKTAGKPPLYQP